MDLHRYREVQVDVCPICRGLWLDSGELNALVINHIRSRPPDPPSAARESPMDVDGSSTDSTILIFEMADMALDSAVLEGIADLIVNAFDISP